MKREVRHVPVLLNEVLDVIDPRPAQTIVDCTLGLGGHSAALLERLKPDGRLIAIDFDPANIPSRQKLEQVGGRFDLFHNNFAALPTVLAQAGVERVDAVLADVGVASTQIDDPNRGFSYRQPGPLDMRMDPTRGQPASSLVNRMSERELAERCSNWVTRTILRRLRASSSSGVNTNRSTTTEELMALVCERRDFAIARRRRETSSGRSHIPGAAHSRQP